MKRALLAISVFAAALPALAAPNCAPYAVVGSQCAAIVNFGWAPAGQGFDNLLTLFVPHNVSGPVTFQYSQLNSSLGTSYTGYFGVMGGSLGKPPVVASTTDFPISKTMNPGQGKVSQFTSTCFDPTCTAPPPAAFTGPYLPNMFSIVLTVLAASAADLNSVSTPVATVRFLNNGIVSFEEQEAGFLSPNNQSVNTQFNVTSLNEAATPAARYVYNGSAVTLPFTVFSVTNPSPTQSVSGMVQVGDYNGNVLATGNVGPIPPLGAAGYLLIGRTPGDPLGLLPSSTVLPGADASGIFHGLVVGKFSGPVQVLAQEFNGNAMLNLLVEH